MTTGQESIFEKDGTIIVHGASPKRCRLACCAIFIFLIVLALFSGILVAEEEQACTFGVSPSYVANRTVSYMLCAVHDNSSSLLDLMSFFEASTESFNFLAVGDFGRDGFCCQRDVAIEMNRVGAVINARFVINTGDSFYENGILNVTDQQLSTSWANVYNQIYLRNLPWFGVIGNHDYRGSVTALIDIHNTTQPRFIFEDRYYSKVVQFQSLAIRFIMLDTSPMIPSYHYSDPIMLEQPDGINEQFGHVRDQVNWLENELKIQMKQRLLLGTIQLIHIWTTELKTEPFY